MSLLKDHRLRRRRIWGGELRIVEDSVLILLQVNVG